MSIKSYSPCPLYRPTFVMLTDDVAMTITFSDAVTGFEAVYDATTHLLRSHVRQAERITIEPALKEESKYVRRSSPMSVLMSGDKHDTTPYSGTTGGGRRYFISPAFERAVLGKQDGFDALHDWAVDQGQRPMAWLPLNQWKYDGYFGSLLGSGWNYDSKQNGWSNFRADHLESAVLFGGAALGEDMALAQFILLYVWVARTFWSGAKLQQGWHASRQMRAMGWVTLFFARASFLGLDSMNDEFKADIAGIRPKEMLRVLVDDMTIHPPRIGEQTKPDDRTLVDRKDGSGEYEGEYPLHWAILFFAAGWINRSGLMTSKKWRDLVTYLRVVAGDVWSRSIGAGGVTYAYSTTITFKQSDVDEANQLETDKTHSYVLVDPDGNGIGPFRDIPRTADAEMTAAAIAMLLDQEDQRFLDLLGLLPGPPNMAKFDDIARYMDPAYALLENV